VSAQLTCVRGSQQATSSDEVMSTPAIAWTSSWIIIWLIHGNEFRWVVPVWWYDHNRSQGLRQEVYVRENERPFRESIRR